MEAPTHVWDAIVVGAGPAGCAAAYDLAAAGRSVLLLDKKQFPRHKACAGGLTAKAVKTLRYPIDAVVRETIGQLRLQAPRLNPPHAAVVLRNRSPICVMTVREELDAFCLRKTLAAGARFERIGPIRGIDRPGHSEHSEPLVRLLLSDCSLQARFLIGADGTSGQVRRLCAEGPWYSQGFALEVKTERPPATELTFDFAGGGYAWVFPKKDHLNVGLYAPSPASGLTRDHLLRFVKQELGVPTAGEVTGQYLGLGAGGYRPADMRNDLRDRVFLAGDAGGFADALTGEGIYGALLSGQAAAGAILKELQGEGAASEWFMASLGDYRETLRFSSRAAAAFYADPARGFRLMRLPFVRRTLVKTYTHGLNTRSLPMRVALCRA